MSDVAVFAPVYIPLCGAALVLVAKAFLSGKAASVFELLGMMVGLFLPWLSLAWLFPGVLTGSEWSGVLGNWHPLIGISYRFDGLTWLIDVLGFFVAGAAWLYSREAGPKGPINGAVFLIQTAALSATAMATDLFNLFVCLEVLGMASYVLVASSGKPAAFLAAFSYLMVSAASMVFFLLGLYGVYRLTGQLSYEALRQALAQLPTGSQSLLANLSLALLVAAVAMRVALMPLYGWLPDAHAQAPHAISAVLSGVLIKTPLFALTRLLALFPLGSEAGRLLGWAGALTALVAVLIALSQKDAKRLLAYHSISQIGYVVSVWGAAIHAGVSTRTGLLLMTAAYLHALYHALFKGLLFLTVGTTTDRAASRDVYRLRGAAALLRQSGERFPVTLVCFVIAALSITALPPFNGFASKSAILYSLKDTWQYWVLFAASTGTVASFIKLARIFLPVPRSCSAAVLTHKPASKASMAISCSQALLGLACLVTGIFARPLHALVFRVLEAGRAGSDSGLAPVRVAEFGPVLYSLDTFVKTVLMLLGGVALFFLAVHTPASHVLHLVRRRRRDFHGLFLAFAAGVAILSAWFLLQT